MSHGFVAVLLSRLHDHVPLCAYADPSYSDTNTVRTQQQRILERMRGSPSNGTNDGMREKGAREQSRTYTSFDHKDIVYYVLSDSSVDIAICAALNKLLIGQNAQKDACALMDAVYNEFLAVTPRDQITRPGLRPFEFIKFDTVLQRTISRVGSDTSRGYAGGLANSYGGTTKSRTSVSPSSNGSPYDAVKQEISDVHVIIRKNLDDLLTKGEKLDTMNKYSAQLRDHSGRYYSKTVKMNRMRVLQTYGPPAAVILFILLVLWWRFFW